MTFTHTHPSPLSFMFVKQHKHGLFAIVVILVLLQLSACTTKPNLETQQILQLNHNLDTLKQWKIKGKIAWITSKERQSAYLNWHQSHDNMDFSLSNVLGINLAKLSFDGERAVLEADAKRYEDTSPKRLIAQTTGWDIPVSELKNWVKGAVNELGRSQATGNKVTKNTVTRFDNGLIKQLISACDTQEFQCNDWQIDYKDYKKVIINSKEYQLPNSITLTNLNSKALIKIKVSEWS